MQATGIKSTNRIPEFDAIRGIAVLLVIGYHMAIPGFGLGTLGVDIFFVLSGYLITSILVNEWKKTGKISLFQFYIRRLFRLFPALSLLLLSQVLFIPGSSILAVLFYSANWASIFNWTPIIGTALSHTWSLAVEEQFYLLWPLILLFIIGKKIPKNRQFFIPLALAASSSILRVIMFFFGIWIERIYRGTDTHSDGLFIGCTLALLLAYNTRISQVVIRIIASLSGIYSFMVFFGIIPYESLYWGGYTFVNIAAASLIYKVITSPPVWLSKFLNFKPLVKIGEISYGLYLWHVPVYLITCNFFPAAHAIVVIIALVLTLLISSLSYFAIEKPILRIKDQIGQLKTPNTL